MPKDTRDIVEKLLYPARQVDRSRLMREAAVEIMALRGIVQDYRDDRFGPKVTPITTGEKH